jgi:hypothetical protein
MPSGSLHAVTLSCHPETPTDAVRGIAARVSGTPGGRLAVTYVIEGDLDRVRVPAPCAPRVGNRLWRHTCCEVFIASKARPGYYEFNLSPSGEWAVYAFDGYRSRREGGLPADGPAPEMTVRRAAGTLELEGVIGLDRLPELAPGAPIALALAAVVEASDGALSYWALRHPPGKPDFHHADAFALELKGEG